MAVLMVARKDQISVEMKVVVMADLKALLWADP